jgi:hypothetical protein
LTSWPPKKKKNDPSIAPPATVLPWDRMVVDLCRRCRRRVEHGSPCRNERLGISSGVIVNEKDPLAPLTSFQRKVFDRIDPRGSGSASPSAPRLIVGDQPSPSWERNVAGTCPHSACNSRLSLVPPVLKSDVAVHQDAPAHRSSFGDFSECLFGGHS